MSSPSFCKILWQSIKKNFWRFDITVKDHWLDGFYFKYFPLNTWNCYFQILQKPWKWFSHFLTSKHLWNMVLVWTSPYLLKIFKKPCIFCMTTAYFVWPYEREWFESLWNNYITSIMLQCQVIKTTIYCFFVCVKNKKGVKNQENESLLKKRLLNWRKRKVWLLILSVNFMMMLINLHRKWKIQMTSKVWSHYWQSQAFHTTAKEKEDKLQEVEAPF